MQKLQDNTALDHAPPYAFVTRSITFDAAHLLPNHPGKCKHLHGHTWKVTVTLRAQVDPETGIAVDFGELKHALERRVKKDFDHSFLNDFFRQPTAENICRAVFATLHQYYPRMLHQVTVSESPGSTITINRNCFKPVKGDDLCKTR